MEALLSKTGLRPRGGGAGLQRSARQPPGHDRSPNPAIRLRKQTKSPARNQFLRIACGKVTRGTAATRAVHIDLFDPPSSHRVDSSDCAIWLGRVQPSPI
jgi:hypothetical protein